MIIIRLNRPKFMKLLLVHHISYIWNILGKPIIGIVLLYVLFINPNINVIYAKIPYTAWVNQYSGTGNDNDVIYDIAVDQHDNIYVTGESFVAGNYQDFTTIKYRFNGDTS